MKKLILLLAFFYMLASASAQIWCYQETANADPGCGGLSSGTYSFTGTWNNQANTYDGDFGTSGDSGGGTAVMYINYTKPVGSNNGTLWRVKDDGATSNLAIPNVCWDAQTDQISFKVDSVASAPDRVDWECWNSTDWQVVRTYGVGGGDDAVFEEAINWSISIGITLNSPPDNSRIDEGTNISFNISTETSVDQLQNMTFYLNQVANETQSVTGFINETIFTKQLAIGNYNWSVLVCNNASTCIWSQNRTFDVSAVTTNSETYNPEVFDTSRQTFVTNISYNITKYSSISASFLYNGTSYTTTSTGIGNERIFVAVLDIPEVASTTNLTFNWNFLLTNATGTVNSSSVVNNQTVYSSSLIQCGAGHQTVNYTIFDEGLLSVLTSDFDATFEWKLNDSSSITKTTSVGLSGASVYNFCINANETFFTNVKISIEATGYLDKTYSFLNQQFTNVSQHIGLYLLNESAGATDVIIEVTDTGLAPLEGYTIKIFKFIESSGKYILIEQDATDIFGQIVASLIQNDVKYKMEFYNTAGTLVKSTGDITIACRATICVIPFVIEDTINDFSRFDNVTGVDYSLTFDNSTNIFTFSWNDNTGETATYRLEVKRILFNGTETVCDSSTVSTASSLSCNVGGQEASYRAQAFRTVDGVEVRIDLLNQDVGGADFGVEGLFWAFILGATLIIVGVWSPPVGIILYLAMTIVLGVAQVVYINSAIIIAHIVIAALFIWAFRS